MESLADHHTCVNCQESMAKREFIFMEECPNCGVPLSKTGLSLEVATENGLTEEEYWGDSPYKF